MKNTFLYTIITFLSIMVISGCSYKKVEIYQKSDKLLNCQQLTTEIADIIDINNEINQNTGLETTSLVTWALWPPAGTYNQYNASTSRDTLDARLNVLIDLKEKKNCKFTPREISYFTNKGRVSDIINNYN